MAKLLSVSCSSDRKSSHAESQRIRELYKLPIYKLSPFHFKSFNVWWATRLVIVEIFNKTIPQMVENLCLWMTSFWPIFIKHLGKTCVCMVKLLEATYVLWLASPFLHPQNWGVSFPNCHLSKSSSSVSLFYFDGFLWWHWSHPDNPE